MIKTQDVEVDENKKLIYAVDGIVMDPDGYVALIQSNKEYFGKKWLLPGGKRKRKEIPKKAVLREVNEELGIGVMVKKYVGQFGEKGRDERYLPEYEVVSDCFLLEALKGSLRPNRGEIMNADWFTPEQIKSMRDQIGLDHYEMMEKAGVV
jgi:ADP-ribose pyrophosphatase YjhB (NUDIX family)